MNKFILISIVLLCLLAVLNLNKPKQAPEGYQLYDSQLRDFYKAYVKGDREEAQANLLDAHLIIPLNSDLKESDSALIVNLRDNGVLSDLNLRKLISSAFTDDGDYLPLNEDVEIILKTYQDTRYFLERAEEYKEKIETVDEHLKVKIVTEGHFDLKEDFLNFDLYRDLEMFLPNSSLMVDMGISDGK